MINIVEERNFFEELKQKIIINDKVVQDGKLSQINIGIALDLVNYYRERGHNIEFRKSGENKYFIAIKGKNSGDIEKIIKVLNDDFAETNLSSNFLSFQNELHSMYIYSYYNDFGSGEKGLPKNTHYGTVHLKPAHYNLINQYIEKLKQDSSIKYGVRVYSDNNAILVTQKDGEEEKLPLLLWNKNLSPLENYSLFVNYTTNQTNLTTNGIDIDNNIKKRNARTDDLTRSLPNMENINESQKTAVDSLLRTKKDDISTITYDPITKDYYALIANGRQVDKIFLFNENGSQIQNFLHFKHKNAKQTTHLPQINNIQFMPDKRKSYALSDLLDLIEYEAKEAETNKYIYKKLAQTVRRDDILNWEVKYDATQNAYTLTFFNDQLERDITLNIWSPEKSVEDNINMFNNEIEIYRNTLSEEDRIPNMKVLIERSMEVIEPNFIFAENDKTKLQPPKPQDNFQYIVNGEQKISKIDIYYNAEGKIVEKDYSNITADLTIKSKINEVSLILSPANKGYIPLVSIGDDVYPLITKDGNINKEAINLLSSAFGNDEFNLPLPDGREVRITTPEGGLFVLKENAKELISLDADSIPKKYKTEDYGAFEKIQGQVLANYQEKYAEIEEKLSEEPIPQTLKRLDPLDLASLSRVSNNTIHKLSNSFKMVSDDDDKSIISEIVPHKSPIQRRK